MSHTLAIDVGSSSVRTMLFDAEGQAVKDVFVQRAYITQTTADGGASIDPGEISGQIFACIDNALAQAGAREISRVAMDTLVGNLMGIDSAGKPTTAIFTWADTRGANLSDRLALDHSEYTCRTGCRIHTSYWPLRLLWLRQEQPAQFENTRYWMSLGEYMLWQLFGQRRISLSTASWSGLFDRHRLAWDALTLEQLPIVPEQLSEISNAPFQGLSGEWAMRWPALQDAHWFPSVGDGVASNIGGGCAQPDYVALSLGTSGAMRVIVQGTPDETPPGLFVYRVDSDRSLVGGALSNAGNLYAWLTQVLANGESLHEKAGAVVADNHGLTVLPFLAGERAPGWRDDAQAVFMGMTFDTRPEHLLRAGLEAVAYRYAQILRRLRPLLLDEFTFIANGAGLINSSVWMQIMADVLGARVYASVHSEATIRGAALLAIGIEPDAQLGPGFEPNLENHTRYLEAIERQQRLYDRLLNQNLKP